MHLTKSIPLKALPLCAFLFANLLVGVTAQGGTQNPFDDDDDPAPAPAPAPAPDPAPVPAPNPPAPGPGANNQASYSCPADDGKTYYTYVALFYLQNNPSNRMTVAELLSSSSATMAPEPGTCSLPPPTTSRSAPTNVPPIQTASLVTGTPQLAASRRQSISQPSRSPDR